MGAGAGSGPGGSPSFLLMWIHSLQKDIKEENYIKKKKTALWLGVIMGFTVMWEMSLFCSREALSLEAGDFMRS